MNRSIRSRSLRTAAAVLLLAPLAAFAQGGAPHDRDARGPQHRPAQQQPATAAHRQAPPIPVHAPQNGRPAAHVQLARDARPRAIAPSHAHRPKPGHRIPQFERGHLKPAPVAVRHRHPQPPGRAVGYYQGHTVAYDTSTFVILAVLDLLTR